MKQCPNCHAAVESEATKCKFCGVPMGPLGHSSPSIKSPVKDEIPLKDSYAKMQSSFKTAAVKSDVSVDSASTKQEKKRSVGVTLFAIYLFFMGISTLLDLKNAILGNALFNVEKIKLFNIPYVKFALSFIHFSRFSIYIWGLCALIASIGVFLLKEWARKMTILVSIFVISLFFLNLFILGGFFVTYRTVFLQAFNLSSFHAAAGGLLLLLTILFSLSVLLFYGSPAFFFTRPKVKEQFQFEGTKNIRPTRKDFYFGIPLTLLAVVLLMVKPANLETKGLGTDRLFGQFPSLQEKKEDSKVLTKFKIEGILYSENNPSIMIAGEEYYLNEFVGGGEITHISPYKVTVEFQGEERDYQIGDTIEPPK